MNFRKRLTSQDNLFILTIFLLLIFIYDYIAVSNMINFAYVPDEAWFYETAIRSYQNNTLLENIFHSNDFGYGGLYWSLYTLVVSFFNIDYSTIVGHSNIIIRTELVDIVNYNLQVLYPMIVMRLIAIGFLNAIFFAILYEGLKRNRFFLFGLIALLLSPMVYWFGKIASPEFVALAILFFAVFFYFKEKYLLALFLDGLAVNLKPTILPVGFVLALFVFWDNYKLNGLHSKSNIALILMGMLGFIMGSPILLTEPSIYFQILKGFSNYPIFSDDYFIRTQWLFSGSTLSWEGSEFGSLTYWTYTAPLLVLIFLFSALFSKNKKYILFVTISFIVYFVFMIFNSALHFYFFAVAILLPFIFWDIKETKIATVLLIFLLPFMVISNFTKIKSELNSWEISNQALQSFNEVKECLKDDLQSRNIEPNRVFNESIPGMSFINLTNREREREYRACMFS